MAFEGDVERVQGPLYLDLAVTTYLDLIAQGEEPAPEDFGQPLPAVAARILRDLDSDERDLLRVAALAVPACSHLPP